MMLIEFLLNMLRTLMLIDFVCDILVNIIIEFIDGEYFKNLLIINEIL